MHILMKYQLSSISQKLINPTDPSQITLTYTVLYGSKMFWDFYDYIGTTAVVLFQFSNL